MFVYNLNTLKCGNPVFCKADRFSSPISTWTVQNSLNNANACMPFMHDCLAPLIDPTTGLYTSTGTHSTGLSHQHTIRESSRTRLHSSQQHEYTLSCQPEIYRKPPKYGHLYIPKHTAVSPMVCIFRRVPLYDIHLVCTKNVITLAYSKLDQLADDACTYSVWTLV